MHWVWPFLINERLLRSPIFTGFTGLNFADFVQVCDHDRDSIEPPTVPPKTEEVKGTNDLKNSEGWKYGQSEEVVFVFFSP